MKMTKSEKECATCNAPTCVGECCRWSDNHRYSSTGCDCGAFFCYDCASGTNASEPYRDQAEDYTACPECGKKHYWHGKSQSLRKSGLFWLENHDTENYSQATRSRVLPPLRTPVIAAGVSGLYLRRARNEPVIS